MKSRISRDLVALLYSVQIYKLMILLVGPIRGGATEIAVPRNIAQVEISGIKRSSINKLLSCPVFKSSKCDSESESQTVLKLSNLDFENDRLL